MIFDPLTLWSVVLFVGLMLAAAMVLVWLLTPEEPALLHWAAFCALFVAGTAGVMARGVIPDFLSIEVANGSMLLGYGLLWTGLRVFDRKRPGFGWIFIAPVLWILLCQLPPFREGIVSRIVLGAGLASALALLSIRQLWRGWVLPSRIRGAALGFLAVAFVAMLARIPAASALGEGNHVRLFTDPRYVWVGVLGIAVMILATFTLVLMVRERSELLYRSAAQRDALTGLLNRRGFMEEALPVCRKGGPMALMILDLDRFKQVNDAYGHAAGDRVLVAFAEVLRFRLQPDAIVARIGGEEFVALLPVAQPLPARHAAEEVRRGFREELQADWFGSGPITCSASIGLAVGDVVPSHTALHAEASLAGVMERADAALYEAKAKGRDRVEVVFFGTARAPAA